MGKEVIHKRYKGLTYQTLFAVAVIALMLHLHGFGQTAGSSAAEPWIQVTTLPGNETYPALSPDGRWLAFVSNQNDNQDIWVMPASGGVPKPLISHPAADFSPAWTPDGNALVFVSTRDDAMGDLWRLSLRIAEGNIEPTGRPKRLTDHFGKDTSPAVSPDGKWIAFTSDRSGRDNVWVLNLKRRNFQQVTFEGGREPDWLPDSRRLLFVRSNQDNFRGSVLVTGIPGDKKNPPEPLDLGDFVQGFPAVAPNGKELVWVRITRDTNGDGKLDWSDKSGLWQQEIFHLVQNDTGVESSSSPIQLTLDADYALYPCWGRDGWIYYSSNRGSGVNIWKVSASGPIPCKSTAKEQYAWSQTYLSGALASMREPTFQELELSRLSYQKVVDDFPDSSDWCAKAWYQISQLYGNLGLRDQQTYVLRRILRFYSDYSDIATLAEVDYQVILWRESTGSTADTLFTTASAALVDNLHQIIDNHPDQIRATSLARLSIGNAYFQARRDQQALEEYLALRDIGKPPDIAAEAQMQIAHIFEKFGNSQEVIPSYLRVVQDYPDEVEWNRKAIDRILASSVSDLSDKSDRLEGSAIEGLQKIIQQFRDVPNLAAVAELRIGQELYRQHQLDLSLLELERLEGYRLRNPNLFIRTLCAEARLLMAKICLEQGNTTEAIIWYRKVMEEDKELSEGRFSFQAKTELLSALIARGERLEQAGDFSLALAEYRRAVILDSGLCSAWQGMIRISYQLKQLGEMQKELEQALHDKPEDPVLWYAKGLLLSYENQDSYHGLVSSNQWLLGAIARNPSLTPAYVTLGFNYLGLDELGGQAHKRTFLKAAGESVGNLARSVTFRRRPPEPDWIEKAINILRTGIAINNESEDPGTEAHLLVNLGNAYYQLGEFGYGMAAGAYLQGIVLDSLFQTTAQEALVRERLGHCLIFVGNYPGAAAQLQRARNLYVQLGDVQSEWRVLLRLGELYMFSADYDRAGETYRDIYDRVDRVGQKGSRALWRRNQALEALSEKDWKAADQSAVSALAALDSASVFKKTKIKNYLKFKVLGLAIPLINFGPLGTGTSKAEGFSQQDEWELNQSIRETAVLGLKDYDIMQEVIADRLRMAEFNGDVDLLSRLTYQMGVVKFRIGDYQVADSLFHQNIRICIGHPSMSSSLYGATRGLIAGGNLILAADVPRTFEGGNYEKDFTKQIKAWEVDLAEVQKLSAVKGAKSSPDEAILSNLHGCLLFRWLQIDKPAAVSDAFRKWELAGRASALFEQAVSQAEATGNVLVQAVAEQNLGRFYAEFGDVDAATEHLRKSYQMAVANQLTDVLWRTEYALAEVGLAKERGGLTNQTFTSSPGKNFLESKTVNQWVQESLDGLENTPVDPENYEELQGFRHSAMTLYDLSLDLALDKRDGAVGFLETGEHREALRWLWAASSRPFVVKQESQKFIWGEGGGNAPFLQKEIQRLSAAIRAESEKETPDQKIIASLRSQYQSNLQEYQQLLDRVWKDDPEFGSLFSMRAATVVEVQEAMDRNEAVLRTIVHRGKPYSWIILPDTVYQVSSGKGVTNQIPTRHDFTGIPGDSLRWTWVLDPSILHLSTDSLSEMGVPIPGVRVSRVGDFRSYLVAKSKREVPGGQGVVLCQGNAKSGVYELPKSWVTVATNHMTSSQVLDAISKVNILYVDLPMVGNASQPLSSYFDLGSKPLYFSQLFSRDLPAVAVLVRWNVGALNAASQGEVMNALLKSLMFSGIPTLVIIPTGANPSSDKDWAAVANFGRGLLEKDAATFLAMADSRFRGWILLGSQGMDAGEITAYAQENFKKTVQKGNLNLQEGNTEWATRYYQRARQMAVTLGQNSVLPNIDQLLLRSAFEGKRWQEAEEVQQRLLDIATNTHDHAGVLLGWKNLAVYRTRLGNYPQALAAWDQVLVMAKESGDQPALVNTYLSQSDLFRSLRDCPKALKAVASAYEAALNAGRVDLELTALVQKGKIQFEFDDIDSSLSTLNNAQTLLDSVGASESSVALEASIFEIKGRIMAILERFPEALENTQRALKVAGSDSTRMGYLTQRMADLYWESGQLKSATQWAAKADSLFQRLGDKSYQLLNQNTRSLIRLSYGDRDEAVRLAGMALEYATDLKDSANMAIITRNMGLINLESKQPEQAILRFREAKSIDARLQRSAGLAHDLANLGLALFQAGQLDSARTSLEVAISLGQPLSDRRPEVKGYVGLALLEQQNGDYQFALERLDRAREAIQNRAMGQYLWRIWYLRASIYKQQNQASKALEADEQAISVLESDPVASGNYHPTGISLRPVDAFDHAVKTALFMGEVERAFLLSDRKRQWLREQPFQMEGLAHQPTSQSSVAWTELRQKLSSGSVLLSFHAAPDTTFMFIATRDELVVRGIARGESALRSLVEGMRTAVEKLLSVEEVSRQLCQEILSPAESWLSSAQTVYIMPDGPLWSVPFCALMDNDGHLLIDRFPIMYLTGLDRLAEMGASDAHGIQRLVAFAYPRSDVVPGELVFAEREVRRISLEDPMAIPLIDENAREVVLDTMRLVDSRVHFACHGWSALDDPLSTGLVLKADVNHDGIWTAHEIASKSLQCPLVFLNLCPPDRGIGNFRQRNLVQAFVEAGCSDIICPLWKVEDLAAAIAAKLFYRYLQEGNSSNQSKSSTTLEAETLRRAQMGVRDKVNSHPAYWAGYEFLF